MGKAAWGQHGGKGEEEEKSVEAMMACSFGLGHSHVFAGQSLIENGHIARDSHENFQDADYFGAFFSRILSVNKDSFENLT